MKYKAVLFDTTEATQGAFLSGRCQVYTTDMSDLAGARTKAPNPDDYVILPEVISKNRSDLPSAAAITNGSRLPAGC